jgi:hypothetical protein
MLRCYSEKLLDFKDISKTKCRLHGNVCSSVSNLDTAIYTDCSCTRQYRAVGYLDKSYYPTDDVILATIATLVAASEANERLYDVDDDPDYFDFEYPISEDDKLSHMECLQEDITGLLEDAVTAAADAAAAATPGDAEHASYVNVARMAAESAKVSQNAMALAVDAATAKIASRKATDKAVDAAKKAAASSAISNRAATDFATAVEVAASMDIDGTYWDAKIASRKADDASMKAANTAIATVADYAAYAAAAKNAAVARGAANDADMATDRAFEAAETAETAAEAAAKAVKLIV